MSEKDTLLVFNTNGETIKLKAGEDFQALAAGGNIQIWLAPIVYAAGYGLVIFNSLRLVRFGEEYGEAEEARRRIEDATPLKPQRAMATS